MTVTKRLFRQRHPLITGFFILGVMFVLFWSGITFFVSSFNRQTVNTDIFGSKDAIGVIELKGVITTSEDTLAQLDKFKRSPVVKAIVVRIDSPGGAVGASQEIFREIRRTNQVKPVVASMGSVAASGGFYAALGAGTIMASPGTLTGSMGVILKFPNLEALYKKIGYKEQVIKSGKLKDIGSSGRSLSDEERELLQDLLDEVHNQFIADIVLSRNLSEDKVRQLADGRIFSGQGARDLGLIDELGNFNDAVMKAAMLAGMPSGSPKLIYPEEDQFSLLKIFSEQKLGSLVRTMVTQTPTMAFELFID